MFCGHRQIVHKRCLYGRKPDLDRVEQTELTTLRVVEVVLPLVQRLEAVHQTTVESIAG